MGLDFKIFKRFNTLEKYLSYIKLDQIFSIYNNNRY